MSTENTTNEVASTTVNEAVETPVVENTASAAPAKKTPAKKAKPTVATKAAKKLAAIKAEGKEKGNKKGASKTKTTKDKPAVEKKPRVVKQAVTVKTLGFKPVHVAHKKDDAREVAKTLGFKEVTDPKTKKVTKVYNYSADAIRILRALRASGGAITREQLKLAVGITGLYSSGWLNTLWMLNDTHMMKIDVSGGKSAHLHSIGPKGLKLLEKAEKLAAEAEAAGK